MTTNRYWQNKKWYHFIVVIVFNLVCSECEYSFEGWFDDTNSFNKQKFPLDQLIKYQNEIKEDSRHINISISYFLNSMSISKKK